MKLAEALAQRKDLTTKIAELERRAKSVATVQEGQTPVEDPIALAAQVEERTMELVRLVHRINRANVQPLDGDDATTNLAELIVERDHLRKLATFYQAFAEQGKPNAMRYSRQEIATVSTIPVAVYIAKAEEISDRARKLDLKIQKLDWQIDI